MMQQRPIIGGTEGQHRGLMTILGLAYQKDTRHPFLLSFQVRLNSAYS